MEFWTNNTYANWMITQGVPNKTACLVLCKYSGQTKTHVPDKLISISKDFVGADLVVPKDRNHYELMSYQKLKSDNNGLPIYSVRCGKV